MGLVLKKNILISFQQCQSIVRSSVKIKILELFLLAYAMNHTLLNVSGKCAVETFAFHCISFLLLCSEKHFNYFSYIFDRCDIKKREIRVCHMQTHTANV